MGEDRVSVVDSSGAECKDAGFGGKALQAVFDISELFVAAMIIVAVVITFLFRSVNVEGESMMYTLHDSDRLVISNFLYTPAVGDIVVLNLPDHFKVPIIKRIIATENQTINITKSGEVYVDGEKRQEDYIHDKTVRKSHNSYPVVVPKGCVFVMGDNRMNSSDSRDVGCVSVRNIVGRAVWRVLPFKDFGAL